MNAKCQWQGSLCVGVLHLFITEREGERGREREREGERVRERE